MYNIISALVGALIAVMLMFNGTLSGVFGNYTSSVIIHIVGLVSILLLLLVTRSKFTFGRGIPLYLYSAGTIGVFTVIFSNLSYMALGISIPLALGLFGQSLASIIIDHFGLFGMKSIRFRKKKIIGLVFVAAGIVLMTAF